MRVTYDPGQISALAQKMERKLTVIQRSRRALEKTAAELTTQDWKDSTARNFYRRLNQEAIPSIKETERLLEDYISFFRNTARELKQCQDTAQNCLRF